MVKYLDIISEYTEPLIKLFGRAKNIFPKVLSREYLIQILIKHLNNQFPFTNQIFLQYGHYK